MFFVLFTVATAACTRAEPFVLPPPPTTQVPPSTVPAVDLSKISLPKGVGRTTTSVPIGPGPSSLEGTVSGPDGPVDGATVQIVRLVGDGAGSLLINTGPDGKWAVPNILGGRYRVRAWSAPSLAQPEPQIFFLTGNEPKKLSLTLNRYEGLAVASAVAPDPPQVDQPTSLVVAVTTRTVGSDGVVRASPVARISVELTGSGSWRLDSSNPTTTDGNGQAKWTLRCQRQGAQPMSVLVGGASSFPLTIPSCAPAPTTTTSAVKLTTSTTRRTTTTS